MRKVVAALFLWRKPLSAAFRVTVDNPARFTSSKAVGAHLGLTPMIYQSGETDRSGHITKAGDHMLRHLLYEATSALMTRCRRRSKLRAWGIASPAAVAPNVRALQLHASARSSCTACGSPGVCSRSARRSRSRPPLSKAGVSPLRKTAAWTTGPVSPTRPLWMLFPAEHAQ